MKLCLGCSANYDLELSTCPSCGWSPAEVEGFVAYAPELAYQSEGYHPEQIEVLKSNEGATYFWFEQRAKLITEVIERRKPDLHSWLEIGFGTGYLLDKVSNVFPAAHILGSDVFVAGLRHSKRDRNELVQMDATQIPFIETFDGVGAFDVLEHISDDQKVINEVFKSLKPGGIFCATVPQHNWLWSSADDNAQHVRRYAPKELAEKMETAGFQVMENTSFMTTLLPLMLISRLRAKKQYDRKKEFQIPGLLNWLFGKMFAFDRLLIRFGLRLPVGGSRLVLGQKPRPALLDS